MIPLWATENNSGGANLENALKTALLILVVLYILSPVDLVPGPIDDLIISVLYIAANTGINRINNAKEV